MKHFPLSGTLPILALVSLTACVDDKYDLSDIDTTTEIKVKDLIIPINLDVVKLGDIISIKEGSVLNEIELNGEKVYAVNTSGSFNSDPITISEINAPAPAIDIDPLLFNRPVRSVRSETDVLIFDLNNRPSSTLNFTATDIDKSIISIDRIGTDPIDILISFDASSLKDYATFEIKNVNIDLPSCLELDHAASSGVEFSDNGINVASLPFTNDGKAEIKLVATGVKQTASNAINLEGSDLTISEEMGISGGSLVITPKSLSVATALPDRIQIDLGFKFSPLTATSFSGRIRYDVEGISISPVELNDFPDFISGENTDIVLANPQIYLNLNNPVGEYALSYESGVNITPIRNGVAGSPLSLDNNGVFLVPGVTGFSNLYLSPSAVTAFPEGFSDPAPTHFGFSALSYAISGDGIPEALHIDLVDPRIPEQSVNDFRLGTQLPGIEGKWEFLAPLALKNGSSQIIYTDRKTGWNDEDVDAITITSLTLGMVADSALPLDAELSGYPLDTNGNRIPGVTIKPVTIKAETANQPIDLVVTGTVEHLDGFEFTATVKPSSDEALSPDQTLSLKNIRAKVSGSYTKKL